MNSFLLIRSEKFNFSFINRPRCFWVDFLFIRRLLKKTTGWLLTFFLREKISSLASLNTSQLNIIFHWYACWEIFDKSSLGLFKEFECCLTTEKIGVSSAKSLGLESNLLGKSFIYTKKNNGPKIDPWGTPALIGDHLDYWLLRTTLWCLFLRNEFIRLIFSRETKTF